jgi:preprotein translocase subunit SecA
MMDKLGLEEGQVIEHPWVTKSIEIAQRRVEQHNFEIRKQLLEYDNVMNKQREVIYGQRRQALEGASLKEDVLDIADKMLDGVVAVYANSNLSPQEWDAAGLINALKLKFGLELDKSIIEGDGQQSIKEALYQKIVDVYAEKEKALGQDLMRHLERMVFLQIIDSKWKDHLYAMDNLREGIGLRAYGQRDPLIEYKREAFEMFNQMVAGIEEEAVETIFRLQAARPERFKGIFSSVTQEFIHPEARRPEVPQDSMMEEELPPTSSEASKPLPHVSGPKVGRNEPCPCGSGKKYKKCCGR